LVFTLSFGGGLLALAVGSLEYFVQSALPFEIRKPLEFLAAGLVLIAGPKVLPILKKIFEGI
jgi:hypothetical protein